MTKRAAGLGLILSACNALAGLDDLGFTASGAGGVAGSFDLGGAGCGGGRGGDGGSIGGSGGARGVSAPDWSGDMLALYLFEAPVALGLDASGHGLDLTAVNGPEHAQGDAMQGLGALLADVAVDAHMVSDAAAFHSDPGLSFTYGGWFKATAHPVPNQMEAIAKTGGSGYLLARTPDARMTCWIGDVDYVKAQSIVDSWQLGEWLHGVCRFDNDADTITGFIHGGVALSGTALDIANGSRNFGIPTPESGWGFSGLIDEAFVVNRVLSDDSIRRIHACGVDGKLCVCDPGDPTQYLDCGRRHPGCTNLGACNRPAL